jgi:hypothetical protein
LLLGQSSESVLEDARGLQQVLEHAAAAAQNEHQESGPEEAEQEPAGDLPAPRLDGRERDECAHGKGEKGENGEEPGSDASAPIGERVGLVSESEAAPEFPVDVEGEEDDHPGEGRVAGPSRPPWLRGEASSFFGWMRRGEPMRCLDFQDNVTLCNKTFNVKWH